MKHLLALLSVLMFVVCSGCGDSHESLAGESVSTMKELVSALEGVKDEASAKSAKPQIKSLMEKVNSINERQAKLPKPSEGDIKSMESKYGKEMEELARKMQSQMMRIAFDPKIGEVLQDLDQSMKKPIR